MRGAGLGQVGGLKAHTFLVRLLYVVSKVRLYEGHGCIMSHSFFAIKKWDLGDNSVVPVLRR